MYDSDEVRDTVDDRRCVLCGEPAAHELAGAAGRPLPVCDEHVLPAYRIEVALALRAMEAAYRAAITQFFKTE